MLKLRGFNKQAAQRAEATPKNSKFGGKSKLSGRPV